MDQNTEMIISGSSNPEMLLSNSSINNNNNDPKITDQSHGTNASTNENYSSISNQILKGSVSINSNTNQLDTKKEENSKKFFVKLFGYEPKFFSVKNFEKKLSEIIEEYLQEIKVNINDKIKKTFSYKGKIINLNDTIKNIGHLGWITSKYEN